MWLTTTQGFYSVVRHRADPSKLIVRGRAREDLDALRAQLPDIRVFSDASADYRWRAVITEAEWVSAVAQLAGEIDYDNFKAAVGARQGHERASVYSHVWAELLTIQRREDA